MTYSEAEAYCREKGMELITFKTGNIYNRFKEYGIFGKAQWIWVGAKRGDDGKYRWRTGEEVDPKAWDSTATKTEECVCMVAGGHKRFYDRDCEMEKEALCEYRPDHFDSDRYKDRAELDAYLEKVELRLGIGY